MAAKGKSRIKNLSVRKPVLKNALDPGPESFPPESHDKIKVGDESDSEEEKHSEAFDESEDENESDEDINQEQEGDDEDNELGNEEEFAGFGSDHDNDDGSEHADVDAEEDSTRHLKLSSEVESEIRRRIAKKNGSSSGEAAESSTPDVKKRRSSDDDKPGVLYIGRIPHGFYESQMRAYFSQFGDILRLRLSRNKKSGASKHYAFIEFASAEVAQIVADTMNNYLLYGHLLKVSVVPENQVHEKMFVGSNRKFKRIPRAKLAKHLYDKKRNDEELEKLVARENKRRKNKQEKLHALGIDYSIPTPEVKSH
ncbi:hypothetical protein V1525DRAFT_434015 [Lipomyces kononenkoae]|uniref:Uncharacterized protein n=1 Tax=Lipomyces kononenkoae TaxID=34357 RepID=A0ACC3SWW6_LIPKO